MYCTKCGRELSPEAGFCGACGTPVKTAERTSAFAVTMPVESMTVAPVSRNSESVPGRTQKRGKIKAPILVLVLLVAAAGIWFGWTKVSGSLSYHTNGFDTPQEALDYFVDAVADMDYEKALTAFPIERAAENYNFYAMVNRVQAWMPTYQMVVPGGSEGNKQLNQHFLTASVERQINNFIFSFFAAPDLRAGVPLPGEDVIRELFKDYNVEDIKKLKAVQMIFAEEELQKKDVHQENVKKTAEIYGGDTLEDYIVTYQIGSNAYMGGVEFIKYGEKYYIWQLSSPIGGTPANCYVTPVEE